jgi:hypothetical protein
MKTSILNSRNHTFREALGGCKFLYFDRVEVGVFMLVGRGIQHVPVMKHGSWRTYAAVLHVYSSTD